MLILRYSSDWSCLGFFGVNASICYVIHNGYPHRHFYDLFAGSHSTRLSVENHSLFHSSRPGCILCPENALHEWHISCAVRGTTCTPLTLHIWGMILETLALEMAWEMCKFAPVSVHGGVLCFIPELPEDSVGSVAMGVWESWLRLLYFLLGSMPRSLGPGDSSLWQLSSIPTGYFLVGNGSLSYFYKQLCVYWFWNFKIISIWSGAFNMCLIYLHKY